MKGVVGEILEIYIQGGTTKGLVRVKGDMVDVPLMLIMDAKKGDRVIIESGMAVSSVYPEKVSKN
jgi:hydrogenase maturation factor